MIDRAAQNSAAFAVAAALRRAEACPLVAVDVHLNPMSRVAAHGVRCISRSEAARLGKSRVVVDLHGMEMTGRVSSTRCSACGWCAISRSSGCR